MRIFRYERRGIKSKCGVSTIDMDGSIRMIVLTELPENTGKTVDDSFDYIATHVYKELIGRDVLPTAIKWVEHYFGGPVMPETFERINLVWSDFSGGAYSLSGMKSHLSREDVRIIKEQMIIPRMWRHTVRFSSN